MKNFCLKLLILIISFSYSDVNAQTFIKISGLVKSNQTIEAISGATIKIVELNRTLPADSLGKFYTMVMPGSYTFHVSAIGKATLIKVIKINNEQNILFNLEEKENNLNEVVFLSGKSQRILTNTEVGVDRISINTIKKLPIIFGERDIMKSIQLLPGIKSAGEGGTGLYVRGGTADQNLIIMDEVPIYNPTHLMGFFSTFNPDVVKDITVYKAGMPAQYGGNLSSVLDVRMNQGNMEKFSATGDIGLISSKLTLQGPIQSNKSAFLISGRRTYIDALLKLSNDKSISQNALYFYDLNAKLDFQIGKSSKLTLSGYNGQDKLGLSNMFDINWGNTVASVQLKQLVNSNLVSLTTASFNNYKNKIDLSTKSNSLGFESQIKDLAIKQDFFWSVNPNHKLKFGFNSIFHTVSPGVLSVKESTTFNAINYQKRNAIENAFYLSNNFQVTNKLNLTAGLRLAAFGVFWNNSFINSNQEVNIGENKKDKLVKTYINLEPRLALSYLLNTNSSLKISYERNVQNMHMISNSTSSRPTDKWMASSNLIKPEISDQVSLGYYKNLNTNYSLAIESYYKGMQNQIDYMDGADLFNSDAIESQLLFGKGRAYGLEVSLKKTAGDFTGWISYTLAKTERQITGINSDEWYNARQDRTHDIAIVGMYELSKKISFSAAWIYYTGNAITSPTGKYNLDGQSFFYYSARNADRMPNYHRLDLGANINIKKKKNSSSDLAISLYNAYGRKNAYTITFRESKNDLSKTEMVKTSLFQFLPSISYSFKFL